MWKFFKKKPKPVLPSSIRTEEHRKEEMEKAKARFAGFTFTEEYGSADLSEFLFLDEKNKQIGIFKKEKNYSSEVVKTIPFGEMGEVTIEDHQEKQMIALWHIDGPIGWNENKINELLDKFDDLISTGGFYKIFVMIREKKNLMRKDYIPITFYDGRSDEEGSVKRVKNWFKMFAFHLINDDDWLKVEKKNRKKEQFLKEHELVLPQNRPFFLTDIFLYYDKVKREFWKGPFSGENFGGLTIEALRGKVLFLRDSRGDYHHSEYNQRWLNHIFQKWGVKKVKVLLPNDRIDKISLMNNPVLTEKLFQELLHLSSLYNNVNNKLGKAKIMKVKGEKIYIGCDEEDIQALRIWWGVATSDKKWIPIFLKALVGREYELIFDTKSSLSPAPLDNESVRKQMTGDRVLKSSNREKEQFLNAHDEADSSPNGPFFLTSIFRNYDMIKRELLQGPFSSENFRSLTIEAYRDGVLFLRDSNRDYHHSDHNQRWLNHVFQKWGVKKVKVLSPNDRVDKIYLINNPTLTEQLFQELINLSSLYNKENQLSKAKIVKVKEKKIYISCKEEDVRSLKIWWRVISSNKNWIPAFFQALVGREYELIFDTKSNLCPAPLDYEVVWKQVAGDQLLKSSHVQSFQDNTFVIYFTDPKYQANNRLRIYNDQKRVVSQLKALTGLDLKIEIVDTPVDLINVVSPEVLEWIKGLESSKENMSMTLPYDPEDGRFFVFVDDQLFIHVEKYEVNQDPQYRYLMKRDVCMDKSRFGNLWEVKIRRAEVRLSEDNAILLRDYVDSLHQWQMEEVIGIQEQMDRHAKVKELIHRFYEKEIKNRFRIFQLDYLLTGKLDLDQDIQKFSKLLIIKGYVEGKDYLITEAVRKKVFQECIQDAAESFRQGSDDLFQNQIDMSYKDSLRSYHQRLFSNIDNNEDVAAFTAFLLYYDKKEMKEGFRETVEEVKRDLRNVNEEAELDDYEAYLFSESSTVEWDISMVDVMDGHEFEHFLSELFTMLGYHTEVTKGSGDYGIDLIASRQHVKIGIQAKCYSDKVPNKAVQEVIAGLSYYGLDQGMVITNNYFTEAAKNQAEKANIILWDRNSLIEQMRLVLQ